MIGDRIRSARKKKGLTMKELGSKLKLAESTIAGYEQGHREPSASILVKLAEALETTSDYLLERSDNPREDLIDKTALQEKLRNDANIIKGYLDQMKIGESENKYQTNADHPIVKIPVLGTIKAGYDSIAEQEIVDWQMISNEDVSDGVYFYLIVSGDSMIDEGIREGFRVLVRQQDYVEEGKIGVVLVNGDEATLKRVYYQDSKVILQASNRNMPPRIMSLDDVRIQGQVTKVEFDV